MIFDFIHCITWNWGLYGQVLRSFRAQGEGTFLCTVTNKLKKSVSLWVITHFRPPTLNRNAGAGHVEQLGGLSTYVSGSPNSKLAILLISDVYGAHTFLWHFSFFCLLLWCALIFTSNCDLGVGFWLVRIPLGGLFRFILGDWWRKWCFGFWKNYILNSII